MTDRFRPDAARLMPEAEAERLFDWRAAVAPLLAAHPGTRAVACCWRCGKNIPGLAAFDARGFVVHPGSCPRWERPTVRRFSAGSANGAPGAVPDASIEQGS